MTVLVFGTFDIIHPGHLWFLEQAKKHGDKLAVIVARDCHVEQLKNHAPRLDEQDRLKMVRALKMVDQAFLGDPRFCYERLVKKIKPDIICLGYDQKVKEEEIKRRLSTHGLYPKIVRLKAYNAGKYKSSKIAISRL